MDELVKRIREDLFSMQDKEYKAFHAKLVPNINPDIIIGVRTPVLRQYAKRLQKEPDSLRFLEQLPHQYYEENNLHGFLIEGIKDYDTVIYELERFLPYVDNWATCDLMSPKLFKKNLPKLLCKIKEWVKSSETYTIRFGIEMLMSFYLDEEFKTEYLDIVTELRSEEYYVNMMIAWFTATALAKQYEAVLPVIKEQRLDMWTHNKAIQKAIESNRITKEQKDYLRTLKMKI